MQREYGEIRRSCCDEHGRMLGDIAGMESMPVLRVVTGVTEDANEEGDVAMIVEGAGAGQPRPPSRKRRRVTQEEDLSRDTTRAVPQPCPDIPTHEELDQLLDRLESIEVATIDLANEITQRERVVADSFRNEADEIVAKVATKCKVKEAKVKEGARGRADDLCMRVRGERRSGETSVGEIMLKREKSMLYAKKQTKSWGCHHGQSDGSKGMRWVVLGRPWSAEENVAICHSAADGKGGLDFEEVWVARI